jgi:hypothetical protein
MGEWLDEAVTVRNLKLMLDRDSPVVYYFPLCCSLFIKIKYYHLNVLPTCLPICLPT